MIQQALHNLNIQHLNQIQTNMLEKLPEGRDILLLAPTGSGKTLAFLLPLLHIYRDASRGPFRCLITAPSRELAIQIADVWKRMHTGINCIACYGGHDIKIEAKQLAELCREESDKPYLLISTPGRLKDHYERGQVGIGTIQMLIIDEYDKLLELGFEEEMRFIIDRLHSVTQRIFTSATKAVDIAQWTGFKNHMTVDFGHNESASEAKPQLTYYQVKSPVADKLETLKELLQTISNNQAVVFANYREAAERIFGFLTEQGIDCVLYHGGLNQESREKAIIRLRQESTKVLVATDLAARGLDLPEVDHIIHYHLPQTPEAWTHRNGRTARANTDGCSYIIYGPNEQAPEFVPAKMPYFRLAPSTTITHAPFTTIYIGRGKREKISRGDVLGFFTKVGGLQPTDIGRIDLFEHSAFAAIRRELVRTTLEKVKGQKIKGMKTLYLPVNK